MKGLPVPHSESSPNPARSFTGIEVPRLPASSIALVAGEVSDAPALRRIVEAQAEDLIKLRRELVGLRERANAPGARWAEGSDNEGAAFRAATPPALLGLIRKAQEEISASIEHSRWLRLGRRLGVARPAAWESDDWRSPLLAADTASVSAPSTDSLMGEYLRLTRLQKDLSRSRWRRFGHWLRLSRPFEWDLANSTQPKHVLAPDLTPDAPPVAGQRTSPLVDPMAVQFVAECRSFAIDTVLDIGADLGQFGASLRRAGWTGQIVSFEQVPEAHTALSEAAADDALWDVAERCAIGSANGSSETNMADGSRRSSLSPMAAGRSDAAVRSTGSHREACAVRTLDDYIAAVFSDATTLFALNIATQGSEKDVLEGLRHHRPQVRVILCDMLLAELHDGAAEIAKMVSCLATAGFTCVGLEPALRDPRSGRLLQVSGLFVTK